METNGQVLVTPKVAAQMLSICETQLRTLKREGHLTPVPIGKRGIRYAVQDLHDLARALRAKKGENNGQHGA